MCSSKLLVLDLNHTLLCRQSRTTVAAKNPTPRPYLTTFLSYIFHSDPATSSPAWSVFVWSSARPHNVKAMCSAIGLIPHAPLKGLWTRENLGLTPEQYHQRVNTIKDLELLWKLFAPSYGPHNSVLLDNDAEKASKQPYNLILLSEFDPHGSHWKNSKKHETKFESDNALLGVIGKLHSFANVPHLSESIKKFQKEQAEKPGSDWGKSHNEWVREGEEACRKLGIPISKEWDKYWQCTSFQLSREEVDEKCNRK